MSAVSPPSPPSQPSCRPTIVIDARKLADFGIGTYLRGLLAALARLDLDSRYLLLAPATARELLPGLPANFSWIEEDAPGYSVREQWSVGRHLARIAPDLFHSPHYVLPLRTPTRVVVTIHDLIHLLFPGFLPNPLGRAYARFLLRRAARRADRILTVSEASASDIERHLGVDRARIEVTWNGIDETFRRPRDEAAIARGLERLGLAPGYFLFLGNPKPHKNLERTVRAFSRLQDDGRQLVIAGAPDAGPERDSLDRWTRELALGTRLVVLGRLAPDSLPTLVQGAMALLLPSLYEGFGLPLAEAMAAGTPVIASTTPALVEIAGGAAVLVDPLDEGAIADAMQRLIGDPELRQDRARAGLLRSEQFRWESTAARTLAVYRQVLGNRTTSPGERPA